MIRAAIILAALIATSPPAHAKDNNPFSGATSIDVVMTLDPPRSENDRFGGLKNRKSVQGSNFLKDPNFGAETCIASEYGVGDGYHGKRAADGSIFNTYASAPYTVAHVKRRLGSYVTVTNLATGLSIRAKVTDRGPFYHARCVDLGRAGALAIGMSGLAKVTVR